MRVRWLRTARLVALSVALACGERAEAPAPEPEVSESTDSPAAVPQRAATRRALWVLAEGDRRTLEQHSKIEKLIDDARLLGMTDLFVQVYRGGRSWYPSTHADPAPYRAIDARDGPPLPRVLAAAHAAGLRVHAWFNVLSLAGNRDAPLLRELGRDAVHVDRRGRSLLDYPGLAVPPPDDAHLVMGTPGLWLDPASPGVIEYLEAALDDLLAAAPGLDGVHLDFIRHPMALPLVPGSRFLGLDFGYGAAAREGFAAAAGRFRRGAAWDAYRRARVDDVVRRLSARLPADAELSAAVIAYADRAYLTAMQDWRRWLEQGWLDFAVAMAYTRDDALLRYQAHGLVGGVAGSRVWLGLGTWLFASQPDRAAQQLQLALAAQPAGVAVFSYDAIAERPALMQALR